MLVEAFDPATTIPVLQREQRHARRRGHAVPHGVPRRAARAARRRRCSPRCACFLGGGAPKPPQLHYDVKAELGGVGIVSGYGLTECPILTMASVHDTDEQLADTEGAPTPGVELQIVKLDGDVAGRGEEGEIRVKGPQLMQRLPRRVARRRRVRRRRLLPHRRPRRCIDADGYVTITGRLKDIIIRKGENISAKEVEDLLFTHPKIADVAVIGLPDPRSGERACAVVVAGRRRRPADARRAVRVPARARA